jgi:transposase
VLVLADMVHRRKYAQMGETLSPARTVGAYKSLAAVERAFRSLKTVDLYVRPIGHRLAERVRAHVFLCM